MMALPAVARMSSAGTGGAPAPAAQDSKYQTPSPSTVSETTAPVVSTEIGGSDEPDAIFKEAKV